MALIDTTRSLECKVKICLAPQLMGDWQGNLGEYQNRQEPAGLNNTPLSAAVTSEWARPEAL